MAKELDKTYQPKLTESKIYQRWERSGFFSPDNLPAEPRATRGEQSRTKPRGKAGLPGQRIKPFSISMPPPNVTGELHLGHATGITIEDIIIRYRRMKGDKTLFLPGTDHAGISTQIMVERLIATEGLDRNALGRDKFVKRVWDWKKRFGSRITEQIRQLGASCDWSREHFTMDATLTKAVQTAFIKMYGDGLIYRGFRIVNWCPRCGTAISDLEVKHVETKTKLWFIRYPIFGTTKYIIVATTRPETMLGDTAVAVNPQDRRYREAIGKTTLLPIVEREIPIIADSRVDMNFGTGAVKVTPAHDALDYEIGLKHKLAAVNVIGQNNKITKEAGEFFGKSIQDARLEVIRRLDEDGLIEKNIDYLHNQARCDRCSTPVEPLISKQWFVKIAPLAKPAIQAVKSGKIKITPKRFEKIYFHWLNNIHDWCISRQLWWGHQIPVWYCGNEQNIPDERMGFAETVVPQVLNGKTVTYRLRDHHFTVGDRLTFENSATGELFGIGTINEIKRATVGTLPLQNKAHYATYVKREELIARFRKHYPHKRVTSSTPAWIYTYSFTPLDTRRGCGEVVVSVKRPARCPRCKRPTFLRQDQDTLDTWFSSGLWTFSTLGWPNKTKDLELYHPTAVMETGWDILFFWVVRMVMMSLYLVKEVPFKTVYLHGLVLDKDGKKMSKSKGTGVDPLPMAEKYGTDAIRLSLVLGTKAGQDFRLYEEKIAGYRNFVNKLWNVARYILSQPNNRPAREVKMKSLADAWIMSRLQQVIQSVTDNIERLEFSEAGMKIYDFLWHEAADWYLEISKTEKNINLLHHLLNVILKLSHPFIPFVTEEIWSRWHGQSKKNLLMVQPWPTADEMHINGAAEKEFGLIKDFVVSLRNFKAAHKLHGGQDIRLWYWGSKSNTITSNVAMVKLLTGLNQLTNEKGKQVTGSFPGLDYYLSFKQDKVSRRKDIEQISHYIQKLQEKLSNEKFLENAPAEIVAREKAKLAEQQEKLKKLI